VVGVTSRASDRYGYRNSGGSTFWVPEQGGSESGVFYSSVAKYLVFYWEEGDQGGSCRWEAVHAYGTREEIAADSFSTDCASEDQIMQMVPWEGPTDDGYPRVA
jgi:hypothetical protein